MHKIKLSIEIEYENNFSPESEPKNDAEWLEFFNENLWFEKSVIGNGEILINSIKYENILTKS